MESLEKICKEYLEEFGELPMLPKLINYSLIADLMQDAIISRVPVSQDEINQRVREIDEPVDLS